MAEDNLNEVIKRLYRFTNNIIKILITEPQILFQMIIISGIFILFLILSYSLLFKKKPLRLYQFLFQKDKKLIIVVLMICIGISFLWDLYFFSFTKDDAYITFRYAKNLAEGKGIVFNTRDNNPVEGYSNFLWVILSTIPHFLNLDVVLYTKIFSMILSVFTIIMLFKFANLFYEKKWALIAPLLYTLYYPFQLWTVGCLETPLLVLLIICVMYFAYKETVEKKLYPKLSVLFSILYSLARIDGIIYIIGFEFSLIIYYLWLNKDKSLIVQRLFSIAIISSIYSIYFLWRWNYYGYLLPNTFYTKRSKSLISMAAIEYIALFLIFSAPIILLMIFGTYKTAIKNKDFKKLIFLIVPVIINFVITLNLKQFNAGQGFRYLLPGMPFIITISIDSFKHLKLNRKINFSEKFKLISLFKHYCSILFILSLVIIPTSAPLVHKNVINNDTNEKHYRLAKWFNKHIDKDELIAYVDMGVVPYYSELDFVDMWGVVDEEVAHNGFSVEYILDREPTFIMFKIWGPSVDDFLEEEDFEENYELFFTIEFKEIDQYLEEIEYDLEIYKLIDFDVSNNSLEEKFD
ncbi:MAG: hypothetical protein ACFFAN_14460 [Promethearchaeota archaeon]